MSYHGLGTLEIDGPKLVADWVAGAAGDNAAGGRAVNVIRAALRDLGFGTPTDPKTGSKLPLFDGHGWMMCLNGKVYPATYCLEARADSLAWQEFCKSVGVAPTPGNEGWPHSQGLTLLAAKFPVAAVFLPKIDFMKVNWGTPARGDGGTVKYDVPLPAAEGMSMAAKIALGLAGLAIVGFIGYRVSQKKKATANRRARARAIRNGRAADWYGKAKGHAAALHGHAKQKYQAAGGSAGIYAKAKAGAIKLHGHATVLHGKAGAAYRGAQQGLREHEARKNRRRRS